MKTLWKEILDVLIALGYIDAAVKEKGNYYSIYFSTYNGGFEYMTERHKNVVKALAEEKLMEFFYINDIQFIYIEK